MANSENKAQKVLSLLGLARRAGKLSMGHDSVKKDLLQRRAKLVIFTADASDRLKSEINFLIEKNKIKVDVMELGATMNDMQFSVGKAVAVFAVTDENFANGIKGC